jgi:acetaldehyde dehydrogenase
MTTTVTPTTIPAGASGTAPRRRVAIIGSGNIGTDLMIKIVGRSESLEMAALVGIDPTSDGLAKARSLGVVAIDDGVVGLLARPELQDIELVFDATSAATHHENWKALQERGIRVIDLTPAAIGPFVVPPVNLDAVADEQNLNMVTCGGQATVPMVAAISAVTPVHYAEIVASIASRSAGPGTRANIDEFTVTTSRALVDVGGAARGKAIIILNPAEPAMIMRDTVMCLVDECDLDAVEKSVTEMVERVARYVPGYRLTQRVHVRPIPADHPDQDLVPELPPANRLVLSVFLEVEGAGDYLPPYAGNLDIMTSAALQTAETLLTARSSP